MTLRYLAYGLVIETPWPMPELLPASDDDAVDVTVRVGTVDPWPSVGDDNVENHGCGFWVRGHEACHFIETGGAFLARNGREIIVDPIPEAEERLLRLSVLGPALGLALLQRGFFVLHASAVSIDGGAVAFLGSHGWGKSTLAAYLQTRGHVVLTDDVLVIRVEEDADVVIPSYGQIKLWPDAATELGNSPDAMPQLHPEIPKRGLRFVEDFTHDEVPLRAIVALAGGEEHELEEADARELFPVLLRHWYGARFGEALRQALDPTRLFGQATALLARTPGFVLRRPRDLGQMGEVCDGLERALGS